MTSRPTAPRHAWLRALALGSALLLPAVGAPAHGGGGLAVSEAEARAILRTPLERTIGAEQAAMVQEIAVLNGLLDHCGLRWQALFDAMARWQREGLARSEPEIARVTVWHGFWQAQTLIPALGEDDSSVSSWRGVGLIP